MANKLHGRPLCTVSARDLLRAAAHADALLVALIAPVPAAMAGFVRAARDAQAPLLLARPNGAGGEKGPQEAREDAAFVEAALRAADEAHFGGPIALLKEPPRAAGEGDAERVQRELDAGFTGMALAAADTASDARDAALAAASVCQLELGLEIVPLGGAEAARELAAQLRSRGSAPSAVRLTGLEDAAGSLEGMAVSTALEAARPGVRQIVASGPFLRALRRSAPEADWARLQAWADESGASLEQAAAHHARTLRELPPAAQERLEALCHFEAAELFARLGVVGTGPRLVRAFDALFAGE